MEIQLGFTEIQTLQSALREQLVRLTGVRERYSKVPDSHKMEIAQLNRDIFNSRELMDKLEEAELSF